MSKKTVLALVGVISGVMMLKATPVLAVVTETYTNDNFYTSTHDQPISLYQTATGGFYGFTKTGKLYEQKPIENDFGVRLHKFSIDEAYFYISDKGTIDAPTDLAALSIYFSRG